MQRNPIPAIAADATDARAHGHLDAFDVYAETCSVVQAAIEAEVPA